MPEHGTERPIPPALFGAPAAHPVPGGSVTHRLPGGVAGTGERGRADRWAAALLAGAVLLQLVMLADTLRLGRRDLGPWYVSELEASGVAGAGWLRGGFAAVGALVVVAGVRLLWRMWRRGPLWSDRRGELAAWAALTGYGGCAAVSDLIPMPCAPDQSADCRAWPNGGPLTWPPVLHSGLSVLAVCALGACTVCLVRIWWSAGRRDLVLREWAQRGLGLLGCGVVVELSAGLGVQFEVGAGLSSRLAVAFEAGWLLFLAVVVGRVLPGGDEPECTAARR